MCQQYNPDGATKGAYCRVASAFDFKAPLDYSVVKSITETLNYTNGKKVVHTINLAIVEGKGGNVILSFTPSFYGTDGIDNEVKNDRTWYSSALVLKLADGIPTSITITVTDKWGNVSTATTHLNINNYIVVQNI